MLVLIIVRVTHFALLINRILSRHFIVLSRKQGAITVAAAVKGVELHVSALQYRVAGSRGFDHYRWICSISKACCVEGP